MPTNDPDKVIKGSEFTTEFTAIQTAFGLAAPAASPTFTGTVTIASVDINGGTIDGVTIGGSSAGAITGTTITGTSFVSSGDMTFGDNAKAIFGAGSDLQIYHDGSNSYIDDAGTGALQIRSNGLYVQKYTNENMIRALADGAVSLYYDNAIKLDTTSTGIDVSGTVTADGLTVESTTNEGLKLKYSSIYYWDIYRDNASGDLTFTNYQNSPSKPYLSIGTTGDISFYEDTGTTAKFFWDASAEALGIGTSSPDTLVHLSATADAALRFEATDTTINSGQYYGRLEFEGNDAGTSAGGIRARIDALSTGQNGESALVFNTSGVGSDSDNEAMRIDSSGRLLVGTTAAGNTSPSVQANPLGDFKVINGFGNGVGENIFLNRQSGTGDFILFRYTNSTVGSISTNGSTTAYNTSSDYRLKDVDGPITTSGAYIDALKPVQGSWKVDGSRFIGLIAHEVQEVSETQIATGEKDGEEMQGMDYSAPELIANLIAEIQSLRARVAQLEGV